MDTVTIFKNCQTSEILFQLPFLYNPLMDYSTLNKKFVCEKIIQYNSSNFFVEKILNDNITPDEDVKVTRIITLKKL